MTKSVRLLNGYRLVYLPTHPSAMRNANWDGYVYEHIVVAEAAIKRRLHDNEVVHHLDGDRANNRYANLLVLDRGQHNKLHAWLAAGAPLSKDSGCFRANSVKSTVRQPSYCDKCGKTLQFKQRSFCSNTCSALARQKVERPSKEALALEMNTCSWLSLGRKYGVSDNAVRKWAKQYDLL